MATVANPPTYRKVFFAQLEGLSGTLAQLASFLRHEGGQSQGLKVL